MTGVVMDTDPPETWAGYRRHSRARSSGTLVVLLDAEEALLDPCGGRWYLMCEHGFLCCWPTQRAAISYMPFPEEWCEMCYAAMEAKQ